MFYPYHGAVTKEVKDPDIAQQESNRNSFSYIMVENGNRRVGQSFKEKTLLRKVEVSLDQNKLYYEGKLSFM